MACDGWPAARAQYLLRGRACAVSPWPGVRTYGVWPQVLFTVEDGERAEIWVDRPLPSQDDELLLRGRYVAGRGEIESPGESAGEGTGQGAEEGAGPGAGEGSGEGAGPSTGPGAGEGGRVEVMIARALFEALAQLHDVPADLPEGAVEFVAAQGEGRDEDGIEN